MNVKPFELLLVLNFCHFLGDYTPLSRPYMLSAKRFGTPLWPIYAHATIHALLFYPILLLFTNNCMVSAELSLFQLGTHFIIDVFKGKMNYWCPKFQDNTSYDHWMLFGADQFLHQVVIITIVYLTTILT